MLSPHFMPMYFISDGKTATENDDGYVANL